MALYSEIFMPRRLDAGLQLHAKMVSFLWEKIHSERNTTITSSAREDS
jgi:hypothetical protein